MSPDDALADAILTEIEARLAPPPSPRIDAVAVARRIRATSKADPTGRRAATLISFDEVRALADLVISQAIQTEEEKNHAE